MQPERTVSRARGLAAFAALLAATALATHATSAGTPADAAIAPPVRPVIEVAFVLDTTGSMSGLIEGAKRKIWSIANQMASGRPKPEIRIALIAYRDRGDAYVTRVADLSDDIDAVYAGLEQLAADGGGDGPESVNEALRQAVDGLSWSGERGVYRVVFLVGDAPPHMDYANDRPWAESVRRARERGIVVNAVQCGSQSDTSAVWQQIALAGEGRYVAIRQDGGMLALAAPQDEALASLGRRLSETVIAWGSAGEQAELEAKRERALAAPAADAASRLSYLAKSGGFVNSGRADLLDALEAGGVALDELRPEALPEPLRDLSDDERASFVAQQRARRDDLKRQIAEVSRERDEWVRGEQERRAASGQGDGFDQQVLEAIRSQAAAKGIAY